MKDFPDVRPLSEAISTPIIKAYRAGGYGLVFVFTGTMLLIAAPFLRGEVFRYIVGTVGTPLIFVVLYLFYFQDIKRLKDVSGDIQRNKELIDTVQATAIQMTSLARDLQALAFKNADEIADFITEYRRNVQAIAQVPLPPRIPGIEKVAALADSKYVVRAKDLSASIVQATDTAQKAIEDINSALCESDPKLLKKYHEPHSRTGGKIKELLAK